jgi:hypothetical protein
MEDYIAIRRKWKSNNIRFKVDFEENLIDNYPQYKFNFFF